MGIWNTIRERFFGGGPVETQRAADLHVTVPAIKREPLPPEEVTVLVEDSVVPEADAPAVVTTEADEPVAPRPKLFREPKPFAPKKAPKTATRKTRVRKTDDTTDIAGTILHTSFPVDTTPSPANDHSSMSSIVDSGSDDSFSGGGGSYGGGGASGSWDSGSSSSDSGSSGGDSGGGGGGGD